MHAFTRHACMHACARPHGHLHRLETCRRPVLSKILTVKEGEVALRKPFLSPVQGAPARSDVSAGPAPHAPQMAPAIVHAHARQQQDAPPTHAVAWVACAFVPVDGG